MNPILTVLIIFIIFIVFDLIWFQISVPLIYKPTFEKIQKSELELNLLPGLYAWFLLAFSIYYFVLEKSNNNYEIIKNGSLLGLITYGVYNGTNYATFKDWNMNIFIGDTLWGIFNTTIISLITYNTLYK